MAALRVLVIGYGSIGARHSRILSKLGYAVAVVSRRDGAVADFKSYRTIGEGVAQSAPDYVVIATETSAHPQDLDALLETGHSGPVLVEKPLFQYSSPLARYLRPNLYVGYQLRFHPMIERLREILSKDRAITASFYVGQHLDNWRSGRNARQSYSGSAAAGGGVLRDLSHELDLSMWLFGNCESVVAVGGRFADVTLDSDDAWGILCRFQSCPIVSVQLNYLDRISQRSIVVVAANQTVAIDLRAGTVVVNGKTERFELNPDYQIEEMHRAVLNSNGRNVCNVEGGLRTLAMIDAVERSNRSSCWATP